MNLSRWVTTKTPNEKSSNESSNQHINNENSEFTLTNSSTCSAPHDAITMYVDGSCFGNNRRNKHGKAGIGVVFPKHMHFNVSEKLPGENATNNRAELYAIIRGIEIVNQNIDPRRERRLLIKTDSELSMNICNKWMKQWKVRGWKKADNQVAANLDLLIHLDNLLQIRNVIVRHVRAHTMRTDQDSIMNAKADTLAKAGAMS